jgi:hypothetical protein
VIETSCDILIVGGGVGGTAAALAASSYGLSVILMEQYEWIGGQLTSQAVPPDEHPWIEQTGCTALYRKYRSKVRSLYERDFPLRDGLRGTPFNPGGGFVSALCHEPQIAHIVLQDMLYAPITSKVLTIRTQVVPISAEVEGDFVRTIRFRDLQSGEVESVSATFVIDCTELGDLLPLCGAEYVTGAESRYSTGELHAADRDDPNDVQGFTWCFAAGYDPKSDNAIERPANYNFWRDFCPSFSDAPWPGKLIDWTAVDPVTLVARRFDLFQHADKPYNSLWNYRKIVSTANLGVEGDDITLVNWPQNDFFIQNIVDQPADAVFSALEYSRQLSLSLMYWMQTEAPRPDGGAGYPGLYLATSVMGTDDGLAMAPYIRESRRIKALFTVTEAHVGAEMRAQQGEQAAEKFSDTVGIGSYRIDLHPSPAGRNYIDICSLPFQIPLGALIPQRMRNLIAGNKNIGVTHITNGCYRLHPVEWNIGESAGHLAAVSIHDNTEPREIYETPDRLNDFQCRLAAVGVELKWPEEIASVRR